MDNLTLMDPRSDPTPGRSLATPTGTYYFTDVRVNPPPSPTLSTLTPSVRFATSFLLRANNNPDQTRSLQTIASPQPVRLSPLHRSDVATTTTTAPPTQSVQLPMPDSSGGPALSGTGDSLTESARPIPTQDMDLDPTPFKFKSYELARMLEFKNLDSLTALGGVTPLLDGLGTDSSRGLSRNHAFMHDTSFEPQGLQMHSRDTSHVVGVPVDPRYSQGHDCEGGACKGSDPDQFSSSLAFCASLDERRRVYGKNVLPQRPSKTLSELMWLALKDKVLILLTIAAVVSLTLGLFQDFGTPRNDGKPPVDWVESIAIFAAVLLVVVVGSLNDWQKEQQFRVLNEEKEDRGAKVIRDGVERVIHIKDVVVGDIALLEPGEIIPCDGVFLSGYNVRCDESGMTGQSDVRKLSYDQCLALRQRREQVGTARGDARALSNADRHTDCFIISGSMVTEGVGRYIVVAVGQNSVNGKIEMALPEEPVHTHLESAANNFAHAIEKFSIATGVILFMVLTVQFFIQLSKAVPKRTPIENGSAFVSILMLSLTLIFITLPKSLPRMVSLALAFATKRMTHENLLVRVLGSCETMANATVVCTDKTGTLTQNVMTVVAGSVGVHAKFVRNLAKNRVRSNGDVFDDSNPSGNQTRAQKHPNEFTLDQTQLDDAFSPQLRDLFNKAICVNSTAFEDCSLETASETVFIGSKTETALLKFAKELGWQDYKKTREAANIVQMIPFSSVRKAMGVVVKLPCGKHRLYLKGASEILTRKCTRHVVVNRHSQDGSGADEEIETAEMDTAAMDNIQRTVIFYANETLRTMALCYRDFESWPPPGSCVAQGEVRYDDLCSDLVLLGILAIEDPLRPGVRDAVEKCRLAGVSVKMCTGDNVLTARSIALQCGIYSPGGIIMEGPAFRNLTGQQMLDVVPRLQVLARSSPEDKRVLVQKLKELGETVAVTGDGTPALKAADVGFSMGIAGTEVTKEASDIILMDDNFSSIVKAIMWGRCLHDSVRKFLQFQTSTKITTVIITLIFAFASSVETLILSPVQLLWINFIMDTFAALALATDPASGALLDRKPHKKPPLFNVDMYKQIFFQSIYQIIFTITLHFAGQHILGFSPYPIDPNVQEHHKAVVQTVVFNALVFALIFNLVNCRRLDKKLNVLEGFTRNRYLLAIISIEITVQILIVFFGGRAFRVTPIGVWEWGISLLLGATSIPLGALVRLLPDYPFEYLFRSLHLLPTAEVLPMMRPRWYGVGEGETSPYLWRWSLGAAVPRPTPAYLHRDRSVQHASDTLTGIPLDVRPVRWAPRPGRKKGTTGSFVIAVLSLALTFIGIVFTGIQISGASKSD